MNIKKHMIGVVISVSIVLAFAIAQYFYEHLPTCEDFGLDKNCYSEELLPSPKSWQVKQFVLDGANKDLFTVSGPVESNQIKFHRSVLKTEDGTYYINVFPDALQVFFTPKGGKDPLMGWQDFDFDGKVEFGTIALGDSGSNNLVFDQDLGINTQLQVLNQNLYASHMRRIAKHLAIPVSQAANHSRFFC